MKGLRLVCLGTLLWVLSAAADGNLTRGVGSGPNSVMRMKFEVTIMKIDVAFVDVSISPMTSAAIGTLIQNGECAADHADTIGSLVLTADTMLIRMSYLRDSKFDSIIKGTRKGLEAAVRSNVITGDEFDRIWPLLQADLMTLAGRGTMKGDALMFRIDGPQVRTVYTDPSGGHLLDVTYSGSEWARGIKASFFSRESKFSDKLIKSLGNPTD